MNWNWYKKASVNPWSIFDAADMDQDNDLVYAEINSERMASFIADASDGVLEMTGVWVDEKHKFVTKIEYTIDYGSDDPMEVIEERAGKAVNNVIEALSSMDIFCQIHSDPDNAFMGGVGRIVLVNLEEVKIT
jgi:hypothetical protein